VAVLWWLTALLWIAFAPRRVAPWSAGAAGVLALVPAWLALVRLRLALPNGAQWVLFALLLVWSRTSVHSSAAGASGASAWRRMCLRGRPGRECWERSR